MKTTAILLAALAGFAATAHAEHSRVSIGLTFGSNYAAPVYFAPAPVAVIAAPPAYCAPVPVVYVPEVVGHWEVVTTKTWIPARWVVTRDRWGREYRSFADRHMEFLTNRVWVGARR